MPANATSSEIPDRPWPPRLWWTKRLAAGLLALLVVLALAWLWWGHVARAGLQTRLDALAAAGQPIVPDQLQPPSVPDSQNSALIWNQAIAAVNSNVETPAESNLEYHQYPPYPREWHRLLEIGVAGNAKAIALARQARSRQGVDWNLTIKSPMFPALPSYTGMRSLANIVGDAALHAHIHGDDFEAIERIRDVRALSRAISEQPYLISSLVAIGIDALAIERLEEIAPDLQIEGTTAPTTQPIHPATRAQLKQLIAELLDDRHARRVATQSFIYERVAGVDSLQRINASVFVLRPMFELETSRNIDAYSTIIQASTQPTAQAAQRVQDAFDPDKSQTRAPANFYGWPPPGLASIPRLSRIVSTLMSPMMLTRALDVHYRNRMEMRFAAVEIAVRMYRLDHGAWPQNLQMLVPQYLPEVPVDLYSEKGNCIGYVTIKHGLPDGADRPLIYSVGEPGDGPVDLTIVPTVPAIGWQQSRRPQPSGPSVEGPQFRDLARWAPPPTTENSDESP